MVAGDPTRSIPFRELVRRAIETGLELKVEGYYKAPNTEWDRETGQGAPYNQYTFGALVSEVEVDLLTGMVRVLRMTAVYDVGKAINALRSGGPTCSGSWSSATSVTPNSPRRKGLSAPTEDAPCRPSSTSSQPSVPFRETEPIDAIKW
jgi:hypothetical protein